MGASPHETAEPFRKNAHGAANTGLDGENALDAGLALDFEGQRRDGMAFLGHRKLLRGRPALARSWVGGLRLLDGGSHTAAVVARESLTADEMSGLKPTCSVFGDFLEIYSKGYAATVPIAVGYLTRRQSGQRATTQERAPQTRDIPIIGRRPAVARRTPNPCRLARHLFEQVRSFGV